jgi:hypothetical protein
MISSLKGIGCGRMEVLILKLTTDTGTVRTARVADGIGTWHLPNTRIRCYRCVSLLSWTAVKIYQE